MQLRRNLAIPREVAVNAFDVAQMSGLDVRFLDVPSLEGMFVRDPGLRVLLPSLKHRPRSRVLYSCAHEVGHHQFGHGTKADEYLAEGQSPAFSDEEFLANSFASHLLMPRAAVMDAFQRRQWDAQRPTAQQAYLISGEIGVGYETLLNHMTYTLELIPRADRDRLVKTTPKALKLELTGDPAVRRVVLVDSFWKHVPIDVECGEMVLLPPGAGAECPLLTLVAHREDVSVYAASRPGQETIVIGSGEVPIRVARQHYIGPYSNRYLADPDEH
jgi:hypothetical protein